MMMMMMMMMMDQPDCLIRRVIDSQLRMMLTVELFVGERMEVRPRRRLRMMGHRRVFVIDREMMRKMNQSHEESD